ncbi:hypothetical protein AK830_g6121 [Neonectria ditissima]|uniref:2EXR domain-containing protein n=1 Tax=Neonectria ditissima TaxID=78410 RepID=A0A0N8H706_9HYPO|nr:hypothetical protein AK830_g6121 [Neonectria ditissima]
MASANPSTEVDVSNDDDPSDEAGRWYELEVARSYRIHGFPQFSELPGEIRNMIWKIFLRATTVSFVGPGPRNFAFNISAVNQEARSLVLGNHTTLFHNSLDGRTVRMNPMQDTFLTYKLDFPIVVATPGRDLPYIPFRKVISVSLIPGQMPSGPGQMPQGPGFDFARQEWGTLDLSQFPNLAEYTLSACQSGADWYIQGLQRYWPDIVGEQAEDCFWRGNTPLHRTEAALFFREKGLSSFADTGIEWSHEGNHELFRYVNQLASDELIEFKRLNTNWRFSPLAYHEVIGQIQRVMDTGTAFPELVVRVWIIRPKDKAPKDEAHHSWEEVISHEDDEGSDWDTMGQIRRLWQMTRMTWNRSKGFQTYAQVVSTAAGEDEALFLEEGHAEAA